MPEPSAYDLFDQANPDGPGGWTRPATIKISTPADQARRTQVLMWEMWENDAWDHVFFDQGRDPADGEEEAYIELFHGYTL